MAALNLITYKSLVSGGSLRASRVFVKSILKSEITDLLLQNKQITHHSTISGVVKWLPPIEGAGNQSLVAGKHKECYYSSTLPSFDLVPALVRTN